MSACRGRARRTRLQKREPHERPGCDDDLSGRHFAREAPPEILISHCESSGMNRVTRGIGPDGSDFVLGKHFSSRGLGQPEVVQVESILGVNITADKAFPTVGAAALGRTIPLVWVLSQDTTLAPLFPPVDSQIW